MGFFSRKDKAPKGNSSILASQSTTSVASGNSRGIGNRTSAGSFTSAGTPLSPMSPIKLPKVDLPRPPDPQLDPVGYLRSLGAVRERSKIIMDKATRNELKHFDVDLAKLPNVVAFVSGLIKVCSSLQYMFYLFPRTHHLPCFTREMAGVVTFSTTPLWEIWSEHKFRINMGHSGTTRHLLTLYPGMDDISIFASAIVIALRSCSIPGQSLLTAPSDVVD